MPSLLVVTLRLTSVAEFRTMTSAFGTGRPEGSITLPVRVLLDAAHSPPAALPSKSAKPKKRHKSADFCNEPLKLTSEMRQHNHRCRKHHIAKNDIVATNDDG